jgi:hypothetical protein
MFVQGRNNGCKCFLFVEEEARLGYGCAEEDGI